MYSLNVAVITNSIYFTLLQIVFWSRFNVWAQKKSIKAWIEQQHWLSCKWEGVFLLSNLCHWDAILFFCFLTQTEAGLIPSDSWVCWSSDFSYILCASSFWTKTRSTWLILLGLQPAIYRSWDLIDSIITSFPFYNISYYICVYTIGSASHKYSEWYITWNTY